MVLKNCFSESMQKKRKIERARENYERYTVKKRAISEKKNRVILALFGTPF